MKVRLKVVNGLVYRKRLFKHEFVGTCVDGVLNLNEDLHKTLKEKKALITIEYMAIMPKQNFRRMF